MPNADPMATTVLKFAPIITTVAIKVRAWLNTSLPNYLYVLAVFDSEVDAENYIKALLAIPDLEIEEDPADYLAFEDWRMNLWREHHKEKFGSLSLFKY